MGSVPVGLCLWLLCLWVSAYGLCACGRKPMDSVPVGLCIWVLRLSGLCLWVQACGHSRSIGRRPSLLIHRFSAFFVYSCWERFQFCLTFHFFFLAKVRSLSFILFSESTALFPVGTGKVHPRSGGRASADAKKAGNCVKVAALPAGESVARLLRLRQRLMGVCVGSLITRAPARSR